MTLTGGLVRLAMSAAKVAKFWCSRMKASNGAILLNAQVEIAALGVRQADHGRNQIAVWEPAAVTLGFDGHGFAVRDGAIHIQLASYFCTTITPRLAFAWHRVVRACALCYTEFMVFAKSAESTSSRSTASGRLAAGDGVGSSYPSERCALRRAGLIDKSKAWVRNTCHPLRVCRYRAPVSFSLRGKTPCLSRS